MELIKTLDGSYTLKHLHFNETYHSIFGARTETMYIFVNNVSPLIDVKDVVKIFEVGFGTGFNTLLTCVNLPHLNIYYETIENNILPDELLQKFKATLPYEEQNIYEKIIKAQWNSVELINSNFKIYKVNADIKNYSFLDNFHYVFYDMFSPNVQPDVWTFEIFKKIYDALYKNGVLLTYTSKGQVKRILNEAGFKVQRLMGPPGKRHFIRAVKI
ncbi:MAG: tRNA (5-methylaminomethyl-2-thiouridine)(34)-methyltransferase MnmD [Bacteroidales bacterium]|nr:tRNA (5-methylaminomethyl-2-thiouridine)(34)-methyltransferase MnmD [Bacteroidales bacterium]